MKVFSNINIHIPVQEGEWGCLILSFLFFASITAASRGHRT